MTDIYYLNNDRSIQVNSENKQYSYYDGKNYRDFRNFATMMRNVIKQGANK